MTTTELDQHEEHRVTEHGRGVPGRPRTAQRRQTGPARRAVRARACERRGSARCSADRPDGVEAEEAVISNLPGATGVAAGQSAGRSHASWDGALQRGLWQHGGKETRHREGPGLENMCSKPNTPCVRQQSPSCWAPTAGTWAGRGAKARATLKHPDVGRVPPVTAHCPLSSGHLPRSLHPSLLASPLPFSPRWTCRGAQTKSCVSGSNYQGRRSADWRHVSQDSHCHRQQ